jgi:RNA polymerase sigma-70 factor (ECF subfamily)
MAKGDGVGDEDGRHEFETFVNAKWRRLVGYAYLLTGDFQESQDLAQEALTKMWQGWERLRSYDDPEAWGRRVLYNLACNHRRNLRRQDRRTEVDLAVAAPDVGHLDVLAALLRLSVNQRRCIILHDVIGLTVPEVAKEMGSPQGSVRAWLHRGRTTLSAELTAPTVPNSREGA